MAEALLLACHLALALSLLAASFSHLLLAAVSHLSPSSLHHHGSHPLLRLLRHPLLRLLPPLLALPLPFLPLAATASGLLPLLLLPPLLLLLPLPFLPPHLPLLRPLLLSLPLLLLARAAGLLAASFPTTDLQQHALAVARLLLLAAAGASLASSLSAPRSPALFVAEAALACAGAVGGLWAAQSGLSLYVDACVPAGCHRLLDSGAAAPATRCDVEEAGLRAVAVMDLALSVHCVIVAAVAAAVCLGVARCCGVDGGADGGAGIGRRRNGSSYDALPTVAVAGAVAEMEHLSGKGVTGKSVAQE
ncbi:uncharacterized protein LOC133886106 [Phragmites australis]|uniref:uncharacterized protein LOC133886106 n=1 Tax=Phragmites australis TaxID=29695 RepID=UPI002D76F2DF|nr:uncharacterized protein LOC133886106 [Phragmites australis]